MRQEAQRRGELIRAFLLSGYNVRVEIYEKSVQDPEKPAGDAYKLKHFVMDQFSDVGRIENEQIRTTYGLDLISQMAFDVRLKRINSIHDNYNTQTLRKLQKWTEKRSDIVPLEAKDTKMIASDKEIHEDGEIIDYMEEELDDTVGYFKDWDK